MSHYAVITAGVVSNIIVADAEFAARVGAVPAQDAAIGWNYSGGAFTPPVVIQEPVTVEAIVAGMDALFDTTAQSRRYDNRITCALRAGYAGPFQTEGQAFATWMDACNALGYTLLGEVQAGTRPMPATVAEALALLPEMVWPD